MERVLHRAKLFMWTGRRVCGRSCGLGPKQTHWISVTFAWRALLQQTAGAKLSRLQRHAGLAISGVFRTTPSADMEILLNLISLHILQERERGKMNSIHTISHIANCIKQVYAERSRLLVDSPSRTLRPDASNSQLQSALNCYNSEWRGLDLSKGGTTKCRQLLVLMDQKYPRAQVQVCTVTFDFCLERFVESNLVHKTVKIFSDSQAVTKALEMS